jgi:hypothetical protein
MISTRRLRGFGDAGCGRHGRLAAAASGRLHGVGGDAAADELGAHRIGALLREGVVERPAADEVGMADDEHVGDRTRRDLAERRVELGARLVGDLVASLGEMQREALLARRLRGERGAEVALDLVRARRIRLRAQRVAAHGRVRLVERHVAARIGDRDRSLAPVGLGQQHDGRRAARAEQQRDRRGGDPRHVSRP